MSNEKENEKENQTLGDLIAETRRSVEFNTAFHRTAIDNVDLLRLCEVAEAADACVKAYDLSLGTPSEHESALDALYGIIRSPR